jgi:hypothetical protein
MKKVLVLIACGALPCACFASASDNIKHEDFVENRGDALNRKFSENSIDENWKTGSVNLERSYNSIQSNDITSPNPNPSKNGSNKSELNSPIEADSDRMKTFNEDNQTEVSGDSQENGESLDTQFDNAILIIKKYLSETSHSVLVNKLEAILDCAFDGSKKAQNFIVGLFKDGDVYVNKSANISSSNSTNSKEFGRSNAIKDEEEAKTPIRVNNFEDFEAACDSNQINQVTVFAKILAHFGYASLKNAVTAVEALCKMEVFSQETANKLASSLVTTSTLLKNLSSELRACIRDRFDSNTSILNRELLRIYKKNDLDIYGVEQAAVVFWDVLYS